ncbi:VTT domain-containing protein [Algiphilus sp.]|uniref:VTT domain-containing protein n=3 Tax=Algiphilus sp. TaxID=1872431 RepID=UPI0025C50368|nr:VTT domain-containing protein [Algiphilus sp.]MCK5770312.1 VTT domain-containing protein [Algiphilus sp.]
MDRLQPLLDWIALHPGWAIALLAITSFVDAMLLVGFLMPSYLLLLGVGALISLDALALWPSVLAAAVGAALGDAFNYWLGRRYLEQWSAHRRMARFRHSMARTRAFFQRRGVLALVVARLFGPTRPMGPMIAGAAPMPVPRFALWTAISCLLWAMLYILPGVAIGASLQLAAEVATRLALLLIAIIVLAAGLFWLASVFARIFGYHAERHLHGLLAWSARHRRLGLLPRWLADPRYPETPALLLIALMLLAAGWAGLVLTWGWSRDTPLAVDVLVYRQLSLLHTPWGLAIARCVAQLAELPVLMATATAMVITLLALRRGRAAAHALAAFAFGGIIAAGLSLGLRAAEPVAYYAGTASRPSNGGDLIMASVVFGLLPALLARHGDADRNLVYYRVCAVLLGLVAAAQLYLGQQWFSVATGCLGIGILWMLALGIGYRRHRMQPVPVRRFLPPVALSFAVAAITLWPSPPAAPDAGPEGTIDAASWWTDGWRSLPMLRDEGGGHLHQPLVVQWRGEAGAVAAALRADGWTRATTLNWESALRTLSPSAPIEALPVPPQPLNVQLPAAMYQKPVPDGAALTVLRLWRAPLTVGDTPLWLGTLSRLEARGVLGVLRLPYTARSALPPEAWLAGLPGTRIRAIDPSAIPQTPAPRQAGLLLLQTPDPRRP